MLKIKNRMERIHTSVTELCYDRPQDQFFPRGHYFFKGEDPANNAAKTIVVALNYLVTLLDLAIRLIEEAGINRQNAFNLLKPLIEETLSNIEKVGVQKA